MSVGVAGTAKPTLVMLSGSLVDNDARVLKCAATAAAAGYRLTVVAPSAGDRGVNEDRGGWTLVTLPVGRRAREHATRPRTLGYLGYRDQAQADAARARLEAAQAAAGGRPTWRLRGRRWIVGKRTVVMRYRQARRLWTHPLARPVAEAALRMPWLRDWRTLVPESLDLDEAFAPVVDALEPDVLHCHDVQVVNVAVGVVERAAARGRRVAWIYDAHEHIVGLTTYPPHRLAGLIALEAACLPHADAVLTVCDPIADHLLRQFRLGRRPTVVLNAPRLVAAEDGGPSAGTRSLHQDAGLAEGTPLVVYSGKVDRDRGIDDLAQALMYLPDEVHLVLITNRTDSYLAQLRTRVAARGCQERLHVVPYVAPDALVGYLSGASVGFAGFSHIGNHEVALPNKFFDYLHAGVPMVVSDLQLLGPLVRDLRVGLVYPFGDAKALADAIGELLRDRDAFLPALQDQQVRRRYSWQAQEPALLGVYAGLVAALAAGRRTENGWSRGRRG